MVQTGSPSARAALVVALLLCVALSGCLGKDKGDKDESFLDWLRRDRAPGPEPVDKIKQHFEDDPKTCDGCIPLHRRAPAPGGVEPPPPAADQTVQIGAPRVGDEIFLEGSVIEWSGGRVPFPFARDGAQYALRFLWERGEDDVGSAEALVFGDGYSIPAPGADVTPYDQRLVVGLDDRTADAIVTRGSQYVQGPGLFAGSSQMFDVNWTVTPSALHLFWLGSDLWGRAVSDGETFRTTWTPPGHSQYALRLDYEVSAIRPGSSLPPFHSHGDQAYEAQPVNATIAEITLRAHDDAGNSARWRIYIAEDEAFPRDVRLLSHRIMSPDVTLLPPLISGQRLLVLADGDEPLPWSDPEPWMRAPLSLHGESTFRPDERVAPPILDDRPAYPLAAALADLGLVSTEFQDYAAANPERVLVAADLHPVPVGDQPRAAALEWELVFLDGSGDAHAWTVSRAVAAGVVAPVPLQAEPAGPFSTTHGQRELSHSDLTGVTLAAGDKVAAWLDGLGDPFVDTAHYELAVVAGDVTAELSLGRSHEVPAPFTGGVLTPPAALRVTEDLAAGRIVSAFVAEPLM